MIRSAIVALAIVSASAALAQEAPKFSGDCKPYAEASACGATQWCHWVAPKKVVSLPNGQQFSRKAFCAFKPGFKAGFVATASK